MKNIKNIFGVVMGMAVAMGAASCTESFLTEEPAHQLPLDSYYNTYNRVLQSAVAAYQPMQWYDYTAWSALPLLWDCQADDLYVGGGGTSDQQQLHLISQYRCSATNNVGGIWTAAYSGINRANHLIENAENCGALTDEEREQFIAEGRALRDWYYLILWKTWGNVPYYEKNLEFPYIAEQLKESEVYARCIADLEEVIAQGKLPNKREMEWAGRMTAAACKMLYADFVMNEKDESKYEQAYQYMKQIIDSHDYSLVAGADYDHLFDYDHEWSDEIIMDINYESKGSVRGWGNEHGPGGTVVPAQIGIDGLSYKPADESKPLDQCTFDEMMQGGWGFGAMSREVYDVFEENDLRRDVALLEYEHYATECLKNGVVVNYGGRYQNTGVFLRKLQGRPGGLTGKNGDEALCWANNMHFYRYAETLLNAAELGMTAHAGEAKAYFDQVRARAGLAPVALTLDNLIKERRVEFVGEGKRYFDLVRTGKAATVLTKGGGATLKEHRKLEKVDGKWVFTGQNVWNAKGTAIPEREAWTPTKRFILLPQDEIESCNGFVPGSLVQNEY